MTTILLTRPLAESYRLARRLEAIGYKSFVEPLLTIEATNEKLPTQTAYHAVMITSANALTSLAAGAAASLLHLPCYCVGKRTGEMAREYGFQKIAVSSGNSLDLATLMQGELGEKQSILHIAGADANKVGRDQLMAWGHFVAVWNVYQAQAVKTLSNELQRALKDKGLQAALFFSPKTASLFRDLVERHALDACCAGLTAIGLSDAVMEPLSSLPWQEVAVVPEPTEDAMVTRLLHSFPPASSV